MERRELLRSAAAATIAAIAMGATAGEHDHNQHGGAAAGKYKGLITATAECVQTGDACLAHCLVLLGRGDKALAACARSVNELLAVCTALQKLATQESRYTVRYARLVAAVCDDCEKQCRKHEKHAQCKTCADACASCSKECKGLTA
jgi:Cys-rich four helix bundle protein (predicted Tat secretion target)